MASCSWGPVSPTSRSSFSALQGPSPPEAGAQGCPETAEAENPEISPQNPAPHPLTYFTFVKAGFEEVSWPL